MKVNKTTVYHLLYKFLKEEGILVQYLYNCVVVGHKKKSNAKEMLNRQINEFYTKYRAVDIDEVFSFSAISFRWDSSVEGFHFWSEMTRKWYLFFNKHS